MDTALSHFAATIKSCVIVGGGGYLGNKLAASLESFGCDVRLFDKSTSAAIYSKSSPFIQGDVRNYHELKESFKGVDCVFHVASYGMSGREQLNKKLIEEVNIDGTNNSINACIEANVKYLVYTSTTNVVFGGQPIINGDESLPYFPLEKHCDYYSKTKSIAEQAILKANGSETANGNRLLTCAIRPAGIYGEEEQRHMPRIMKLIQNGLFSFKIGPQSNLVEFVHVDNLVKAHELAAIGLSSKKNHIAAGSCYFISDGCPINNFEFFRPMFEGLGYKFPIITLPVSVMYYIAFIIELIHAFVGRYIINFQPLITRAEVYKTGVTHYFKLDKAKKELGYKPEKRNLNQIVRDYKLKGYARQGKSLLMIVLWYIAVCLIVLILLSSFITGIN
ncbi:uncharacterized protein TRIADDRAFT_21456 [Trichoplax adhaerens]|uniref:3-beta hydroxysteroid dehydrogenase/isomerase domain-containing protein n=1 Tax=Trichoplax adhaerens TaxID=10228 RepID=B3RMG5_TRIAD|nr:hypothetical protein TRIADDRAFT_21456 [Trichoplax adhaerens]EDV27848.1 hypothetical protein TRIADDRAFT_21456 [Trichoplax adhaerens]|eukprot:XP_002109682.1 hypothetical protein TRIADDRAFT_21456 [Trichoplax adhaerens]